MNEFKKIKLDDIEFDANKMFDKNWAVLVASKKDKSTNCLTISWGAYGELWGKKIMIAFVRPERYSHEFIDDSEYFSINFFDEKYRDNTLYLGTHSGRDEDKVSKVNFHYINGEKCKYFDEANLVFILRKIYFDDFKKDNFVDKSIIKNIYGENGQLHTFYIGEIVDILKR
jgi:flavin reductase (DIM6/NTAB) family NADH-FMN oxidoreductase RutF